MLNIFSATGHNSYTKFVEELKSANPSFYNQFQLGNQTVTHTRSNWFHICKDLSIGQILIKSLKERSGIIGRGIAENVMNVQRQSTGSKKSWL